MPIETYRLEIPDGGGLIVRLNVGAAEFWVSSGEPQPLHAVTRECVGGDCVRMILTVADPETVFAKALAAGATEVYPVGNAHGWRLGRVVDPCGLHWEIGHQLASFGSRAVLHSGGIVRSGITAGGAGIAGRACGIGAGGRGRMPGR